MSDARLALRRYAKPAEMLDDVRALLEADEAANTLPLGILGNLVAAAPAGGGATAGDAAPAAPYLAAVLASGRPALAATWTPPFNLGLFPAPAADGPAGAPGPDALVALVAEDLASGGRDVSGVIAPPILAGAFEAAWAARTGLRSRLRMREAIYRLDRVVLPDPMPRGSVRRATPADAELLARWLDAFRLEAVPGDPPPPDSRADAERRLRDPRRRFFLWEVDGRPVSLAGANSPSATGIRIGPVYTPPEERGRGYGSAVTAAASSAELAGGRRFTCLFADLANPTSNRIYRAIGYRPVGEVEVRDVVRLPVGGVA